MIFSLGDSNPSDITIGKRVIPVYTKESWIFKIEGIPVTQLYLIGSNLMLIQTRGLLSVELVRKISSQIENRLIETFNKITIINLMDVPFLTREVRKIIFFEEKRLRERLGNYYLIAKGKSKSILNVYKSLHPQFKNKVKIMDSVNAALINFFEDSLQASEGIDKYIHLQPNHEDYPLEIEYHNKLLHIQHLEGWSLQNDDFNFATFAVNDRIFVYRLRGKIDIRELHDINKIGKGVFEQLGTDRVIIVSDYHGLTGISKKARILLERIFTDSDKRVQVEYACPNSLMNAVFTVQQVLNPKLADRMVMKLTFEEAFIAAIKKMDESSLGDIIESDNLDRLSVKQMKKIINQLYEENKSIKLNQQKRIDQLIEKISDIAFRQDFSTSKSDLKEDDPFYHLFNSFSFLEKDMEQILKEANSTKKNNMDV